MKKNTKKPTTKKNGAPAPALVAAPAGLSITPPRMMLLSELNEAPYNPRVMPPEKMRALKASILKDGLVLNIVVQLKSEQYGDNVIIGGHQRLRAVREICRERGWALPEAVPVVVKDLTDSAAKLLNVALNNIEGEFDPYKLGAMFADVFPGMTSDDVLATGFESAQIEELRRLAAPVEDQIEGLEEDLQGIPEFARSITLSVEFRTVEERDAAKELLFAAAKERGQKPGSVLLEAVRATSAVRPKKHAKANGKKEQRARA